MPCRTTLIREIQNLKKILSFSPLRIQWVCQIFPQKRMKMQKEKTKMKAECTMNHRNMKISQVLYTIYIKNHSNKTIRALININSLRNKFDIVTFSVTEYKDILMTSETKLHDIYSQVLYHLKEFPNAYRIQRNSRGVEILVYVRNGILSN